MAKLHEVLAAEKTTVSAWNKLHTETLHKLKNPSDFFVGHSKSLQMIEDTAANKALEAQALEEKAVTTTVPDTLEYAFGIFANSERLQLQKNAANRVATGTVMWQGAALLTDMPVDELLGLEARLVKVRELYEAMPTLGGAKKWEPAPGMGAHLWQTVHPDVTTKTDKTVYGVELAKATAVHPAQVQAVTKDLVVGSFTTTHRSGACTTEQKAHALAMVDRLLVEVKQARMRANQTEVPDVGAEIDKLRALLLSPFAE
jgi:hypothetical protein